MKYAVILVLLLLSLASSDITLNEAIGRTQAEFSSLGPISPQSIPNYPAVLNGTDEYWIVEFNEIWIPVSKSNGEIIFDRDESIEVYKIHYVIQKIMEQNSQQGYPTKMSTSLNLMLSNVQKTKNFVNQYSTQLPQQFQDLLPALMGKMDTLESVISNTKNSVAELDSKEAALSSTKSGNSDVQQWKSNFISLMDGIQQIVDAGYAYSDESTEFSQQTNTFTADSSNDLNEIRTVQNFVVGIGIEGVPGDMPTLETTIDEWKNKWFDVLLSNAKVEEDSALIYDIYENEFSKKDIQQTISLAQGKYGTVEVQVTALKSKLGGCLDDLGLDEQRAYTEMTDNFDTAVAEFNEASQLLKEFKHSEATEGYQNSYEHFLDSEEAIANIEDAKCKKRSGRTGTSSGSPLDLVFSLPGIIIIILIVAVILFVVMKGKKEERNEEEYYY